MHQGFRKNFSKLLIFWSARWRDMGCRIWKLGEFSVGLVAGPDGAEAPSVDSHKALSLSFSFLTF